jgi:hypothetical protein
MIGASCPAGPVRDIKRTAGQTEAQNRAHGAAIRVARLGCPLSDLKRPRIAHREHFRFWTQTRRKLSGKSLAVGLPLQLTPR